MKGRWCYLYRAIDSTGATIDFLLSALRDGAAAKRLFRNALSDPSYPQPRVINTDQARLYNSAIPGVKEEGILRLPLSTSTGPILEQYPGAGSRAIPTTSEGQAERS